jgi:hypothetical protein
MKTRKALIEEIEKLKEDNKRLVATVAASKASNADLQNQIAAIKGGKRCEGNHCSGCVHAIEVKPISIFDDRKIVCDLSAPCVDFQRKEG